MPKTTNKHKHVDLYVKLPRYLHGDYLRGALRLDELVLLVWLWLEANPYNASVSVSYDGLVKDLSGKYTKNHINKLLLALKQKKYVSFPKQQGRRSSFQVTLNRYPLTNGLYSNIQKSKQKTGRGEAVLQQKPGNGQAEEEASRQKIEQAKKAIAKQFRTTH